MFCKKCGIQLNDGSAICNKCGAKQDNIYGTTKVASMQTEEFKENKKVAIENSKNKASKNYKDGEKGKISVTGSILAVMMVIGVISFIINFESLPNKDSKSTAIGAKVSEHKKTIIETAMGVNQEQAKEIEELLKKVGVEKPEGIVHDEALDNLVGKDTGYRMVYNGAKNIIVYLTPEKKVEEIKFSTYYLYKDGQVVETLQDNLLSTNETYIMKDAVEKLVKKVLKAPATAKFPNISEYSFSKDHGIITTEGYVDAQNSFGAMIRSTYRVRYDLKNKNVVQFIFDGQNLI